MYACTLAMSLHVWVQSTWCSARQATDAEVLDIRDDEDPEFAEDHGAQQPTGRRVSGRRRTRSAAREAEDTPTADSDTRPARRHVKLIYSSPQSARTVQALSMSWRHQTQLSTRLDLRLLAHHSPKPCAAC